MRNSEQINQQIEETKKLVKTKENQLYELQEKINKLENLRAKAYDIEDLKENGIELNIVKVEATKGFKGCNGLFYPEFKITLDNGLSYISMRKLKIGKVRLTKDFIEVIQKAKNGEFN